MNGGKHEGILQKDNILHCSIIWILYPDEPAFQVVLVLREKWIVLKVKLFLLMTLNRTGKIMTVLVSNRFNSFINWTNS